MMNVTSTKARLEWVDIAKGISILLVVIWHANPLLEQYPEIQRINSSLSFLRMPLFFFLSGLFLSKFNSASLKTFFNRRVHNLLYLFVVWGIVIIFFRETLPYYLETNKISIINPLKFFIFPPPVFWFLYCLGLSSFVIWSVRKFNKKIVFVSFIICYLVGALNTDWQNFEFLNFVRKLLMLTPFMYLGYLMYSYVHKILLEDRNWYLTIMLVVLSFVIGYYLVGSSWSGSVVLSFLMKSLWIFSIINFSNLISRFKISNSLKVIGYNSLYIYTMHIFVLVAVSTVLNRLSLDNMFIVIVTVPLSIFLPILAKWFFIKTNILFPFQSPLLEKK